jgi:hypothetical protein
MRRTAVVRIRDQGSGIRDQESGIRNQESGIRNQESGIRNQESGIRNQGEIIAGNRTLRPALRLHYFEMKAFSGVGKKRLTSRGRSLELAHIFHGEHYI